MSAERRRLTFALLLSLLIHTLLLSLTFGGQGLGLPGFGLPWRERRIEAPDLRVVLVPAQVTAAEPAGARSRSRCRRHRSSSLLPVGRPDTVRVPCADPGPGGRGDRARAQADGAGQADGTRPSQSQTPRPVRLLRKRLCAPKGPVTRRPHRSLSRQ